MPLYSFVFTWFRNVVNAILDLSRVAIKYGFEPPRIVKYEMEKEEEERKKAELAEQERFKKEQEALKAQHEKGFFFFFFFQLFVSWSSTENNEILCEFQSDWRRFWN